MAEMKRQLQEFQNAQLAEPLKQLSPWWQTQQWPQQAQQGTSIGGLNCFVTTASPQSVTYTASNVTH